MDGDEGVEGGENSPTKIVQVRLRQGARRWAKAIEALYYATDMAGDVSGAVEEGEPELGEAG
jgi:hypothetical protein